MYLQRVYDIVYGKHAVTTETDGGGNRLVSRCSRNIARPLGQRQALLDETLTSPRVDAG